MARQNKTLGEILKKGLVNLFWGIVAAVLSFLVIWFVAQPILKKLILNIDSGNNAPSSQNNHGNQSAK